MKNIVLEIVKSNSELQKQNSEIQKQNLELQKQTNELQKQNQEIQKQNQEMMMLMKNNCKKVSKRVRSGVPKDLSTKPFISNKLWGFIVLP